MQTERAANSDSTVMYSQGSAGRRGPGRRVPRRCGAGARSGRRRDLGAAEGDRLGDRGGALDLPKDSDRLQLLAHVGEAGRGGGGVAFAGGARKRSRIAARTESSRSRPVCAAKPPSRAALGRGRPRCSRAIAVAGAVSSRPGSKPLAKSPRPSARAVIGVDQRVGARREAGKEVDLVQQGRVLDDQRVGLGDRFPGADRWVGEATEGDQGCAGPLGAEAGEGLGVAALVEAGDREQLGGRNHPLAATAMDSRLEHLPPYLRATRLPSGAATVRLVPRPRLGPSG